MSDIPHDGSLDSTVAFLSEGYLFISNRCQRYRSDIFATRIMLQRAYCTLGEEAAGLFYGDDPAVTRRRAMPVTTLKLLQDRGSVQLLDGAPHRWRKQMLMALMMPEAIERLADIMTDHWLAYAAKWAKMDEVVLHTEVHEILCRSVCQWAGVPLAEADLPQRTREMAAMIEGSGTVGPRNWWAMLLRTRDERWVRKIIQEVRNHKIDAPTGSAAQIIAGHCDLDGKLLDTEVAAVELLNVLRPTVAVARFIVFAALALHEFPEWHEKLQAGDGDVDAFVQEVRRFYPYFPLVGGRARREFEWRGHQFQSGNWLLLDLYGTNHDPRIWSEPGAFRPERFRHWSGSAFSFIPQGGGAFEASHRCAGECITIELMKRAVRLLTTAMHYDVPRQDLGIDVSRMPAIPNSRFVIRKVKPAVPD